MAKSADERIQERRRARHKGRVRAAKTRGDGAKTRTVQFIAGRYYENGVELHPAAVCAILAGESAKLNAIFANATMNGWEAVAHGNQSTHKLRFMTSLGEIAAATKMILDMLPEDSVEKAVFVASLDEATRRRKK